MQEKACLSQSRQGNLKLCDGTSAMQTIVAKSAPGEAHATSFSFYQAASPRRLPQEPTVRSAGAAAVCSWYKPPAAGDPVLAQSVETCGVKTALPTRSSP